MTRKRQGCKFREEGANVASSNSSCISCFEIFTSGSYTRIERRSFTTCSYVGFVVVVIIGPSLLVFEWKLVYRVSGVVVNLSP